MICDAASEEINEKLRSWRCFNVNGKVAFIANTFFCDNFSQVLPISLESREGIDWKKCELCALI